jgi:hypothetical protein
MGLLNREPRRLAAGAIAGLAAAAAFAGWMKADMRITGDRVDDFQLLGGIGPGSEHWQAKGAAIHFINGAVLGAAYTTVEERLTGPGWLRGVSFALIENTVLWPLILLLDRVHPAIRSGELPTYNRIWPFIAENLRHIIYGAVLGYLFDRLKRRNS